jgi:hypothetical protein
LPGVAEPIVLAGTVIAIVPAVPPSVMPEPFVRLRIVAVELAFSLTCIAAV